MMRLAQLLEKTGRLHPEKPAVTFRGRTTIWKDFLERARRIGGALQEMGVEPGETVGVLAFNSDRNMIMFFAPFFADAVMAQYNFRWAPREMDMAVEDSDPRVLFVDRAHLDEGRRLLAGHDGITHLVLMDDPGDEDDVVLFDDLAQSGPLSQGSNRANTDLAALFFTGGTTGRSKAVMLSHQNLFINAVGATAEYNFPREQRFLQSAPIFHLAAGSRVYTLTYNAAHAVIVDHFDPGETLALIEKEKINDGLFVPTMVNMLFSHPDFDKYDLSSMTRISYGASPMPEPLLRQVMARMPGVQFYQGYGMTETSPVLCVLPAEAHDLDGPLADKLNSIGPPAAHCEVIVADEEGRELPPGEVGEIMVRGPNVMLGYLGQPEATEAAFVNGWFRTGDGAYVDKDGYLFLVDRVKDMIISGGENIYSNEVENILHEHPAVRDCAVIGLKDEVWGESVHAVITLRTGKSVGEAELIDFCRERIAHYKCPKSVEVIDELPLSGANKILKSQLRDERNT